MRFLQQQYVNPARFHNLDKVFFFAVVGISPKPTAVECANLDLGVVSPFCGWVGIGFFLSRSVFDKSSINGMFVKAKTTKAIRDLYLCTILCLQWCF